VSLKPLPADKVIKVLVRLGFKPVRPRGSHVILKREDGKK
jgi:predicted RNA binding protein YcfA (HicA-like mRNA interferase family)